MRISAALLLAVLVGACTPEPSSPGPQPETEAPKPNILLVVTDDMRPDGLKVMNFTRNWLEQEGRWFMNAYATTPLCCPSRASIFTGRYAHNHGVLKNQDSHDLDSATTIQAYLQEQTDYRTALVGKYLNSWSVEEDPPHFDRWASYSGRYYGKPFNIDGEPTPTRQYSTYHMAKRARQILDGFEDEDALPWFMYVATVAPHAPFTVAPRYKGTDVPRDRGIRPPIERDLSDKPEIPRRPFSLESPRKLRKKTWRTLLSVDDLMRRLRFSLRKLEEERETLVIFTSDQGLLQGEHGLFAKRLPYTEAIQVPLLMRWPGEVEQSADHRLAANVDIAPTIMEVAGVDPDEPVDGLSLLDERERNDLFIEQLENWRVGLPDWRSLRTPDFQYVEYYSRDGEQVIAREYYDLHDDPWQFRNLFGDDDAGNDPYTDPLSARLEDLSTCRGSACVSDR
jgi:arylsulfatase A-like enzyme